MKCGDKFTRQTVNDRVKQIVTRLVEENSLSNTTTYLSQFVSDIENYNIEQIVYIALDNIEMQNTESLKIGGDVYLVKMTDRRIAAITKKLKTVIDQTLHTPEDKPLILQNHLRYIEPLRNKICIEFRCVAERDLAEEFAHEEALNIIDLLRYAIPSLYPSLYPAYWYSNPLREEQKKKRRNIEPERELVLAYRVKFL